MKTKNLFQKTVLILLSFLVNASLFAQTMPPPKQWDKRFGGSEDDEFTPRQQTMDEGYFLGGY